jgi:hypothetical protein
VKEATFHSLVTHGNGSIGMQISKPVGSITVKNGILTNGSKGQTLVKGVIMELPADGVSVKPGGEIRQLTIAGGITTHGDEVHSYNVEGGVVQQLTIQGTVEAHGKNAVAVSVTAKGQTPLNNISAVSKQGIAVQIDQGKVTVRSGLEAKGDKGDIVEK